MGAAADRRAVEPGGEAARARRSAPRRLGWAWLCLALALAPGAAGCHRDEAAARTLSVFAASSLTEAFRDLAREFEAARPGVRVAFNFAGSQVLRLQIEQGAAGDVYASANASHMSALVREGRVTEDHVFAHNALVVAVPHDNPAHVERFADLDKAERIVVGAPTVPVGAYTRALLDRSADVLGERFASAVRAHIASEESNVRLVLAKVVLGEADAAIVYRTDVRVTDGVQVVPIPESLKTRAEYTIGVVRDSAHPRLAHEWVRYVRSAAGQAALARRGFDTAP
ncbi:MAG: molybdate ABC transporter substrate-binding protein [Myxococcales bacterium]|nr:molybdate ABC transporter substrate-binding protein [Myxococcales bacterium]